MNNMSSKISGNIKYNIINRMEIGMSHILLCIDVIFPENCIEYYITSKIHSYIGKSLDNVVGYKELSLWMI